MLCSPLRSLKTPHSVVFRQPVQVDRAAKIEHKRARLTRAHPEHAPHALQVRRDGSVRCEHRAVQERRIKTLLQRAHGDEALDSARAEPLSDSASLVAPHAVEHCDGDMSSAGEFC